MEIYKITPQGADVYVLFNGGTYVFYSMYYGTMAIAKRSNLAREKGYEFFTVTEGNRHCTGGRFGGSAIFSFVCRFIRKCENKYIKTDCDFERHTIDLADVQPATLAE